jgi:hypothetical protein
MLVVIVFFLISFNLFAVHLFFISRVSGARFGKWRAPYAIDIVNGKPSELVIKEQAWGLARYAAICQVRSQLTVVYYSDTFSFR